MERGDLAVSVRPHYVVVLEGVLAIISEVTQQRRLRSPRVTGFNIHWLDIPLRRLATNKRRFPDVGAEIVTFISEDVADQATMFLDTATIAYDSLQYQPFDTFCSLLHFRDGVQAVYDTDDDRINRYGQLGHRVLRGEDW
jgi:phage baseplate assembly protein gpV